MDQPDVKFGICQHAEVNRCQVMLLPVVFASALEISRHCIHEGSSSYIDCTIVENKHRFTA